MSLYLVDASIYIFRAWFSLPSQLTDSNNQPVNAAYGFVKFLTELLETTSAKRIVVAYDESLTHSFRNEIYPPYKMNRELPPEELKNQFVLCKDIVEALGISGVSSDRYEADDLIGTLAHSAKARGEVVTIVSADKDLAQLLKIEDILWDFARRQKFDSIGIKEKFGVNPDQIVDYLGLCGDAVDNIPGVPSIGPKKAQQLIEVFGSMDNMYQNIDAVAEMSVRGAKGMAEKLRLHKDQALLSKQLATIALDAPIDTSEAFPNTGAINFSAIQPIIDRLGGRGEGLFQRMVNVLQS